METLDKMDKATVKILSGEIQAALNVVAEKYGVTIAVGGGSYEPTAGFFTPKVKVSLSDSAKRDWEANARLYGLNAEDFGKTFTAGLKAFTLSGFAHRAQKMPVLATSGGKTYKFTVEQIQKHFPQKGA